MQFHAHVTWCFHQYTALYDAVLQYEHATMRYVSLQKKQKQKKSSNYKKKGVIISFGGGEEEIEYMVEDPF